MVLSIEERVFLAEYVFREGNSYTYLVHEQFAEKCPETPLFPNADLRKMFANKIKRVWARIDARGHHFQHLIYVHSDFPNALYFTSQYVSKNLK
jgi:hypothetical protein